MNEPILVTGCARSGTSMVSGLLHIAGAWVGKTVGGGVYNPKGFYENRILREKFNKAILRKINADPLGQHPLPDTDNLPEFPELREEVLENIRLQGYVDGPWLFKDAKLTLIWPIWKKAFPNAKWIIVRRDKLNIINSCLKTTFMGRFHNAEGWAHWVDEHLERFEDIKKNCDVVSEIWPKKIVEGDFSELKQTIKDLGLEFRLNDTRKFIVKQAWHS